MHVHVLDETREPEPSEPTTTSKIKLPCEIRYLVCLLFINVLTGRLINFIGENVYVMLFFKTSGSQPSFFLKPNERGSKYRTQNVFAHCLVLLVVCNPFTATIGFVRKQTRRTSEHGNSRSVPCDCVGK